MLQKTWTTTTTPPPTTPPTTTPPTTPPLTTPTTPLTTPITPPCTCYSYCCSSFSDAPTTTPKWLQLLLYNYHSTSTLTLLNYFLLTTPKWLLLATNCWLLLLFLPNLPGLAQDLLSCLLPSAAALCLLSSCWFFCQISPLISSPSFCR